MSFCWCSFQVRKSYREMEGKQEWNRVKNKVKQTRSSFHRLRLTSNEICVRLNKKKTWRQNGIHCDGCLENLASHLIHSKEKAEFCQCSHALLALGTHKLSLFFMIVSSDSGTVLIGQKCYPIELNDILLKTNQLNGRTIY